MECGLVTGLFFDFIEPSWEIILLGSIPSLKVALFPPLVDGSLELGNC
jgi:hypothetical protein